MTSSLRKRDWGTWSMIRAYLHHRRAVLLLYLCVVVFFPLVHFLSRLSMAPMLYSILIISFLLFLGLLIDGYWFYMRDRQLAEVLANISSENHVFPSAANAIEGKYQEIIEELYRIVENSRFEMEWSHADRIEYYTMWVHQIKTPIAAMRLVLQSGEDNPVIEQELFKIEQYAEMALQYVKLSSLQSDLVIGEYELEEIVRDSVKKYATLFIQKRLSVQIASLQQRVVTDSKWLSFIIEQLLANAIKYTNAGGVEIFLEHDALILKDSGIGICAGDLERIFEKGYTGYNGRLDKRASGIGLYMAKTVADSLSVRLQVQSELGLGTRVEMRFPKHLDIAE